MVNWEPSIVAVGIGMIFYFSWMAWQFIDRSDDYPTHQAIGLGLIAVSLVLVWLNTALAGEIIQEVAPGNDAIAELVDLQYIVGVTVSVIVFIYFGLMVMFGPVKAAIDRRKLRL